MILIALVGLVGAAGMGVEGLALGLASGMALSVLMQFPALRRHGFRVDLCDPGVRRILVLAVPIVLGTFAGQVYVLVVRIPAKSTTCSGSNRPPPLR